MLTKFESKSNRVKGIYHSPAMSLFDWKYSPQDSHFILHNHFLRLPCTMGAFSYGIIVWVFSWTGLKNTKVIYRTLFKFCGRQIRTSNFSIGPVRGVAIHPSRALLATGGDDYKIKVWGEDITFHSGRAIQLVFNQI